MLFISNSNLDFTVTEFWNWTNINSYVQATVLFTLAMVFLSICLSWVPGYIPLLGIGALLIDTLLTLPQFLKNWFNHTTFGMKYT